MEEEKNIIPEPKKEEPKAKGNGLLVTILLILVLALAGYIVYDKVIKKDNPQENTEEKQQEQKQEENKQEENKQEENKEEQKEEEKQEPKEEKFSLDNLAGKTFKTKDGKKTLKIVSLEDKDAIKKAKQYNVDLDLKSYAEDSSYKFDYFGYYNNKFFLIYKDGQNEDNKIDSKYVVLGGVKEGHYPQCRDTHEFVLRTTDNTLMNIDYEKGGTIEIRKIGNSYYFLQGDCALGFRQSSVYNENEKVIGESILAIDSNENFYLVSNGYVKKYDKNAKELKKTSNKYENNKIVNDSETESFPIEKDNNLYFLYQDYEKEDSKYIIVDFMNDKEYVMDIPVNDYIFVGYSLDKTTNTIITKFELNTEMCEKCDSDKTVTYTFDLAIKTLTKN